MLEENIIKAGGTYKQSLGVYQFFKHELEALIVLEMEPLIKRLGQQEHDLAYAKDSLEKLYDKLHKARVQLVQLEKELNPRGYF